MLLVKNAKVYAPEYLGVKDILIAGGRSKESRIICRSMRDVK